jgi:hypothetical protein
MQAAKAVATVAYFEREDTPSPNSLAGILMVRMLEKFPGISLDEARAQAHELLNRAAGKRVYRVPSVLTEEEELARRTAIRARFVRGSSPETPLSVA